MQNDGEHEFHSERHVSASQAKIKNPKIYYQYPVVFATRSAGNEGIGQSIGFIE